jgi:hypothetical protein
MSLPVSFKEFAKDPVKAMLFILICVVLLMYNDQRTTSRETIAQLQDRVTELEDRVEELTNKILDSARVIGK